MDEQKNKADAKANPPVDIEKLKKQAKWKLGAVGATVLMCTIVMMYLITDKPTEAELKVIAHAREIGISALQYPEEIIELLDRHPRAEEYVLDYPEEKDKEHEINFSAVDLKKGIPTFMQYDKRWGYLPYGDTLVGLDGSGPLCLSMAGYYLTGSASFHPDRIVKFADSSGFYIPGSGTKRSLISVGGEAMGLDVMDLAAVENKVATYLQGGTPLIAVVSGGDFGSGEHFIVLKSYDGGKVEVIDPSCYETSKAWEFEELRARIQDLWAIRLEE